MLLIGRLRGPRFFHTQACLCALAMALLSGMRVSDVQAQNGPPPVGVSASAVPASRAPAVQPDAGVSAAPAQPLSSTAQHLYERVRADLVQVRTLLVGQGSQASVGSGFVVGAQGDIVTNFHVVSQAALEPDRFRLTFSRVDGGHGELRLLAVDVVNDLAVLRPVAAGGAMGAGAQGRDVVGLAFRDAGQPLEQGEHLYSLGHPLDVGFAVVEGVYNGMVERSHVPSIFFSGSLNPGMSGGPALDAQGRVIGVNVATRLDGQQVSFLVPAERARELVLRARRASPVTASLYPEIARQLTAYQEALTRRFLALPWRSSGHPRYRVPVPQEVFMRCWGQSSPAESKGLRFERSQCSMNQGVFVGGFLTTGMLSTRHEIYDGRSLGPWRYARQVSASFANEAFAGGRHRTAARCSERHVQSGGLPMRAVVCMSAYRKLPGLYDVSVLALTLDDPTGGVLGRFDARGVAFDNALKLAESYIKGFGWTASPSR